MKPWGLKKIVAIANLGFRFVLHLLQQPFTRHTRGLKPFLDHYKADGILPLTIADKNLLVRLSHCIHCGYCDTACPALLKTSREKFPGPSFVAHTFSRSFHDLWASDLDLSICAECSECEKVCPTSVPIKEGIEWIQQKIAEQMKLTRSPPL
jgi:succinate dehydrogenase/fumarate reductase-like Fe-S protein